MLAIDYGAEGKVVVTGRLDAAQAPAAQTFLDATQGTVTLDCGGLEYISSAGLGALLKVQKRLMKSGKGLVLVGASKHIWDIFHFSGFDQIFEIQKPV